MKWLCKLGLHKWVLKYVGSSWLNLKHKEVCLRCGKERKRGTR
jgi:hypothetical protein